MKNHLIIYRSWCGITGDCIEKIATGWYPDEEAMWDDVADTFGTYQIVGIAEIIETAPSN